MAKQSVTAKPGVPVKPDTIAKPSLPQAKVQAILGCFQILTSRCKIIAKYVVLPLEN
jgi:hypothetical protein